MELPLIPGTEPPGRQKKSETVSSTTHWGLQTSLIPDVEPLAKLRTQKKHPTPHTPRPGKDDTRRGTPGETENSETAPNTTHTKAWQGRHQTRNPQGD
ncbi:hypothetical protein ACOMHN_048844 [Nucella lapillus]